MKQWHGLIIGGLLLAGLVLSGCAFSMGSGSAAPPPSALISATLTPRQDNSLGQSGLIMPYDTDKLVLESDCIVLGQVAAILPSKEEPQAAVEKPRYNLYTDIVIQAERYFWGGPGDQLTIRVQGGKIGNLVMWAEDVPLFAQGEKALLFLYHPSTTRIDQSSSVTGIPSYYLITGAMQGKYEIQEGLFISMSGQSLSTAELEKKINRLHK